MIKLSNILDNINSQETSKPRVVRSSDLPGGPSDEQLLNRLLNSQNTDLVQTIVQASEELIEAPTETIEVTVIESPMDSPFPEYTPSEDLEKPYYPSILSLLKYEAGYWICTDGKKFNDQYPAYLWQLKVGYKGKTDKKPEKPSGGGSGGTMDHAQLQHLDYEESGHTGFQKELTAENAGTGISIETDEETGEVIISNTQTSAIWGNIEGDIENQGDLHNALNAKQDNLIEGSGIDITNNVISADIQWGHITGTLSNQEDLEERFEAIEELIPDQASDENQLADKAFVNSSISTNTANFCGTYNVVTDLGLTTSATEQQIATAIATVLAAHQPPIVPTNNDYAFVAFPNATIPGQFDKYDRYKYNGSAWGYEYTLNNSSFTAEQWAAVNSGITSGKVTEFEGKQDALTAGSGISLSGANINTQNIIWRTW